MKRIIITLMSLFCIALFSGQVFAAACTAGTLTESPTFKSDHMVVKRLVWAADGSGDVNGSSNCDVAVNGYIYMVVTDPAADAPTDNYDIVLNDSDGVDVMGGKLADRDTANTEQVVPVIGGVTMSRFVDGNVSVVVSNAGANNDGEIIIYIYKEL